jgi:hypothetical protein
MATASRPEARAAALLTQVCKGWSVRASYSPSPKRSCIECAHGVKAGLFIFTIDFELNFAAFGGKHHDTHNGLPLTRRHCGPPYFRTDFPASWVDFAEAGCSPVC